MTLRASNKPVGAGLVPARRAYARMMLNKFNLDYRAHARYGQGQALPLQFYSSCRVQRVRRLLSLLLIVSALGMLSLQSTARSQAPKVTALRAGRLIDVKSGNVTTNAVILVEGNRIKAVGQNVQIPAGAEIIELGSMTVMPGLIDVHTHLLQNYESSYGGDDPNMILTVTRLGTTKRALLGVAMGRQMLEAGFTAVRDLGNSGVNGDVALRDAIRSGWVVGPRIVASTRALSAAGGQFAGMTAEVQKLIEQEYVVVSGVEEARRAVRQAFYDGADCIKVIVDTHPRVMSLEEMKVIVEEAHRVGKKVAAHAVTPLACRVAADAGVDSIEHGYLITDDALKTMAQKKIYLVPTDYPAEFYITLYKPSGTPTPEQLRQQEEGARGFVKSSQDRLARAVKMGVPIAAGSDEYYDYPGKTRGQASLMMFRAYAATMTPLQILRAATINAADLLAGERALFGSIEAGKFADIIAIEGDPLKDITDLEKVRFVMKGGAVIKNELKK